MTAGLRRGRGPLSLGLDEVKEGRGGGQVEANYAVFANVHAQHTHTNEVTARVHKHTLKSANTSASCQ